MLNKSLVLGLFFRHLFFIITVIGELCSNICENINGKDVLPSLI